MGCVYCITGRQAGSQAKGSGCVLLKGARDPAHTHLVYLAYIEQSSIGWDQAVRGRLSRHWHVANASYCATTLHQHDSTAYDQWSTRLVTLLWQWD